MNANQLKIDQVYIYADGQKELHVMYQGMTEDKYLFIPINITKMHYCGIPNSLCEKEVMNLVKPMA